MPRFFVKLNESNPVIIDSDSMMTGGSVLVADLIRAYFPVFTSPHELSQYILLEDLDSKPLSPGLPVDKLNGGFDVDSALIIIPSKLQNKTCLEDRRFENIHTTDQAAELRSLGIVSDDFVNLILVQAASTYRQMKSLQSEQEKRGQIQVPINSIANDVAFKVNGLQKFTIVKGIDANEQCNALINQIETFKIKSPPKKILNDESNVHCDDLIDQIEKLQINSNSKDHDYIKDHQSKFIKITQSGQFQIDFKYPLPDVVFHTVDIMCNSRGRIKKKLDIDERDGCVFIKPKDCFFKNQTEVIDGCTVLRYKYMDQMYGMDISHQWKC